MFISSIEIENFRSIELLRLDDIGSLNVFVGKNNSGKSTILKGIELLKEMINDNIISEVFSITDLHNRDQNRSIRISGSFRLNKHYINELSTRMIDENPQLSSFLSEIKDYQFINIRTNSIVNELNPDKVISYIEQISIKKYLEGSEEDKKVLLNLNEDVINDLVKRSQKIEKLNQEINQLKDNNEIIGADSYREIKEGGNITRPYRLRTRGITSFTLDTALSTNDFIEFKKQMTDRIDVLKEEVDTLASSETNTEFNVFTGKTKIIPNHIYWIINELNKIKLLHESERKKPIDKQDAEMLLDLKVMRKGPERLKQLQKTVNELLGVDLDAFKGATDNSAEIDVDNHIVDMNGAGIRESLRLILDLEFKEPDVILLEEPEVHLHFELERNIFKYLLNISNDTQIFMTTHSTSFINASDTNNVFLIKKEEGKTFAKCLKNDELDLITTELGINISSLLLSKVLVFVEGPTDEFVIRTYIEEFYPKIPYSEIGIVQMKGVGNYRYYANASVLSILSNVNLKSIFIIDADSRSDEEIQQIKSHHPEYSELYVLPLRCIENYFLDSKVLMKFIQLKLSSAGITQGVPSDVGEFEQIRNNIINSLKPETLRLILSWKYLKPIYPSSYLEKNLISTDEDAIQNVRKGIEEGKEFLNISVERFDSLYLEDVNQFNDIWESQKMSIVPGDKVIDLLCNHFGVRYKKNLQNVEMLTQLFHETGWDPRLKEIIGEITESF